ncbi:MAG: FecR family protein [Fermentimonas sp.]
MKQDEEIKEIIHRFLNGTYTLDEARTFLEEWDNPCNKYAIDELSSKIWDEAMSMEMGYDAQHSEYKEEAYKLIENIEKKGKKRLRPWLAAVASVAATIAVFVSLFHFYNKETTLDVNQILVETTFGERKDILLPDGSKVTLNSCSQISYPAFFSKQTREVKLIGEAFFDVAKDPEKQFIITTNKFDVKVLGTAFNIRSYDEDEVSSVKVERGKVSVDMPDATMKLTAQECIEVNSLHNTIKKHKDSSKTASWKTGCLYFDSTPIKDVVRQLEREYNCSIIFQQGQEFDNLISGEHDNKSLESVLQSLEYTSGIKYKKQDNDFILYK